MSKTTVAPSPTLRRRLSELGENIRLARLRRNLSAKQISERSGITPPTLRAIERGDPTVLLGNFASVLFSLGLDKDLAAVAKDDELGRKLQDVNLSMPLRAKRRAPKPESRQTP